MQTYRQQLPKKKANTSLQHFTTTLLHNTSLQHFSTQHFPTTLPCNTWKKTFLLNTAPLHIQYYSVLQNTTPVLLRTTKYYSVLQSTTLYCKVLLHYYSSTTNVLLQYYSVLQSTTPVLQSTTLHYFDRNDVRTTSIQYYSVLQSTTPVLLRTTKVLQSTTPYYRVLLQYYSVLQSSTKASKTSISCEASSTFQGTSFQNEHFVRGFLNFSRNKLPKRAFRARFPQLFKEQASKTSISCETSATFQATSFQNEHFVRGFLNFSIKELPKSCACHAKRENDLSPWKFEASKRAFRARLPSNFTLSTRKSTILCEFFL